MNLPRPARIIFVLVLALLPFFSFTALNVVAAKDRVPLVVAAEISSAASAAAPYERPYLPVIHKTQAADISTVKVVNQRRTETRLGQRASPSFSSVVTNPLAILITTEIVSTPVPNQGYTFLQTTKALNYRGGRVLLAMNMDGGGGISIDDRIIMTVTHPDGSRSSFSGGGGSPCASFVPNAATDVTQYFVYGENSVEFTLKDECGWRYGTSPIWLVTGYSQEQSWSPNECPFCGNQERQGYAGGPINTYSGNYNYEVTDFSLPTSGQPLRFERTYNSEPAWRFFQYGVYTQPLGIGWQHNHDIRLLVLTPTLEGSTSK